MQSWLPWVVSIPTVLILAVLVYKVFSEEREANNAWTPPVGLQPCQWCGGYHAFTCPYVESLEFDGVVIKRVVLRHEHYKDLRKAVLYAAPLEELPIPVEGVVIRAV